MKFMFKINLLQFCNLYVLSFAKKQRCSNTVQTKRKTKHHKTYLF